MAEDTSNILDHLVKGNSTLKNIISLTNLLKRFNGLVHRYYHSVSEQNQNLAVERTVEETVKPRISSPSGVTICDYAHLTMLEGYSNG